MSHDNSFNAFYIRGLKTIQLSPIKLRLLTYYDNDKNRRLSGISVKFNRAGNIFKAPDFFA